jgi:hypothetical protein
MKTYFKLNALKAFAPYRPKGYLEDVLSYGKIVNDYLELEEKDAIFLVEKYQEKNPLEHLNKNKGIGNNHNPNIWGPILWDILHKRPFEIQTLDFEEYWINIFTGWIPCGECKVHWMQLLFENPIDLTSKKNYYQWTVHMHNEINKFLDRPIYTI